MPLFILMPWDFIIYVEVVTVLLYIEKNTSIFNILIPITAVFCMLVQIPFPASWFLFVYLP